MSEQEHRAECDASACAYECLVAAACAHEVLHRGQAGHYCTSCGERFALSATTQEMT